MHPFIKSMDPVDIQSRFAATEAPAFEEYEDNRLDLDSLDPLIQRLPSREIDLLEMYYRMRKKQKEIAEFFNVSQGAISHRLSRALKRLKFLRDQPKIDGDINEDLKDLFPTKDIEIIHLMITTTCQSLTAKIMNEKHKLVGKEVLTQVKVRHRFERVISKLEKEGKTNSLYKQYYELCTFTRGHLYFLHEVKLPHFDRGFKAVY